jgi:hypothetical protein
VATPRGDPDTQVPPEPNIEGEPVLLKGVPLRVAAPRSRRRRCRYPQMQLLEGRVIIASYNQHVGSFLPSLWLASATKFTRAYGADIVMELIALISRSSAVAFP